MEAGSNFKGAFREFATFRRYFANAQTPPDSLKRPTAEAVKAYATRLTNVGTLPTMGASFSFAKREDVVEIVFFAGAFILLVAMIFATLQYRYRNRAAVRIGGEITRERYKRNET